MNISQTKNRTLSTIPVSSCSNNWYCSNEESSSFISYNSFKLKPSFYSTLQTNRNSGQTVQKQPRQMRRAFSVFKNSQTRVSTMKDRIFDLSQDINSLKQKTKRARLDFKFTSEELILDLKQRESQMGKSIQALNKLAKNIIKSNQKRNVEIKNDTQHIKESYESLKLEIQFVHEKISAIEKQCGFITFASKLKI